MSYKHTVSDSRQGDKLATAATNGAGGSIVGHHLNASTRPLTTTTRNNFSAAANSRISFSARPEHLQQFPSASNFFDDNSAALTSPQPTIGIGSGLASFATRNQAKLGSNSLAASSFVVRDNNSNNNNKYHWSRGLSAKRNKLLNQLNQIELGRKKLELKGHRSFYETPESESKPIATSDDNNVANDNQGADDNNNHENGANELENSETGKQLALDVDLSSTTNKLKSSASPTRSSSDDICIDPIQPGSLSQQKNLLLDQEQLAADGQSMTSNIGNNKNSLSSPEQRRREFDQLELFVTSQVPPNKRVLCLIVRDNNKQQANTRQDQSSSSRLTKSNSLPNPICYLFVQAIVDLEPASNCRHLACQDQHRAMQQAAAADHQLAVDQLANNNNQRPIASSSQSEPAADGQLIMSNQSGDEDDSISISSSLSADLLFVENARAATINKKNQHQKHQQHSSVASSSRALQTGSKASSPNIAHSASASPAVATTFADQHHDSSLINSFSDDEINIKAISDQCYTNDGDNLAAPATDSPLVYPNEPPPDQTTVATSPNEPHIILPVGGASEEHYLQAPCNNRSSGLQKRSADLLVSQLFDNELNQYTGAVGVVLSGKRRKNAKTYLIGLGEHGHSSINCICKLKSNVLGTHFNALRKNQSDRCPIASIIYETNVLGMKGPRKMRIFLAKDHEAFSSMGKLNLVDAYKKQPSTVIQLRNTTPVWNMETQSYVLNFHGRVTQPSVKNFQLMQYHEKDAAKDTSNSIKDTDRQQTTCLDNHNQDIQIRSSSGKSIPGDLGGQTTLSDIRATNNAFDQQQSNSSNNNLVQQDEPKKPQIGLNYDTSVVMQFGRTSVHEFTCDVSYPLSILQAFSIALSSLDSKLACE